jgi:GAF domain-containing protein
MDPYREAVMATVSNERLAEVFVEMADTLVDDFDLIDFLQTVTTRTAELIDVPAVGLLLADAHGVLQFMAASNEATKLLELFQIQNHEGPCLDAFRTQVPVVNADLRQAGSQWPSFAPRAAQAGFRSVHAIPLRLRKQVIGALNLFGADTGALAPGDVKVLQALADIATIGLMQERIIHRGQQITEQLQGALNSRIIIEQAKGALSRIRGVSVDEAYALIIAHARGNNVRLSDLSRAIVSDPRGVPGLTRG